MIKIWCIVNSFLNKDKSAIPSLCKSLGVFSSSCDKIKLFTKNFSGNSTLDNLGILLPAFSFTTNLKLHNLPVTSTLVKKMRFNLFSSKASLVVNVFQWWF